MVAVAALGRRAVCSCTTPPRRCALRSSREPPPPPVGGGRPGLAAACGRRAPGRPCLAPAGFTERLHARTREDGEVATADSALHPRLRRPSARPPLRGRDPGRGRRRCG